MEFFSMGRYALLLALKRSGLIAGDKVIFPAYYCESALEPLRSYGLQLEYVDIDKDLNWHVNDYLISLLSRDNVKALIVTYYFGYRIYLPTELLDACRKYNVVIIKDFTHSFLSFQQSDWIDDPVFSACIFSIRKTLPVSDGGALLMNKAFSSKCAYTCNSKNLLFDIPFLLKRYVESIVLIIGWPNLYSNYVTRLKMAVLKKISCYFNKQTPSVDFPNKPVLPSYLLSSQLCNEKYLRNVAKKRSENYEKLCKVLKEVGYSVLLSQIPKGSVPQVLPVLVQSKHLVDYLRENGIGAFQWPGNEMPFEVQREMNMYPNATQLNNTVICLPIHQDIGDEDINYMLNIIKKYECK